MADYVYDVEVYPNYFGVGFQSLATGQVTQFSTRRANLDDLKPWFDTCRAAGAAIYGFNNHFYDDHILFAILAGERHVDEIYGLSQARINSTEKFANSPLRGTVDLRAIVGGEGLGLKEIGVKLDHPKLQELPYPFDQPLTDAQMAAVETYNMNDLEITARLYALLYEPIIARQALGQMYGVDVLSKKDSGIAEAILRKQMFAARPTYPQKTAWNVVGAQIISPKISFLDATLKAVHETMMAWRLNRFIIFENGEKRWSEDEKPATLEVTFKDVTYTLGLGGIHSRDTAAIFKADAEFEIIDIDVQSYYPNIIRSFSLAPRHLDRQKFLPQFGKILAERVSAKAGGLTELNLGLKIAINSVYGKFGSPYSFLCDPTVGWTVTLNGQLILLMLIELISGVEGAEVLSANTDGVTVMCRRDQRHTVAECVAAIEQVFGLTFEYANYQTLARRDISSYVAITLGGKIKAKGAYAYDRQNLMKKATERIVIDAVQKHFLLGVPVDETIRACTQITEFIDYFKCTSGWHITADGVQIGSLARWYRSTTGVRLEKIKGEVKAILAGGLPVTVLADLPDEFPPDIDYDHYIAAARALIDDIENPKIEKLSATVALADLSKAQRQQFIDNHKITTPDAGRVAGFDLTPYRERYAAAGRSQYDVMKTVMVLMWRKGAGDLTRGDLRRLAEMIDDGTGYFAAKPEGLARLAEWVARNVSPFPKELTADDHARSALRWAATRPTSPKPKKLTHVSIGQSTLVTPKTLQAYHADGKLPKLAAKIAANAKVNGFPLTVEFLAGLLIEAQAWRNPPADIVEEKQAETGAVIDLPEPDKVQEKNVRRGIKVGMLSPRKTWSMHQHVYDGRRIIE